MDAEDELERVRSRALDAIVSGLREAFDVQRCTLRLDVPGEVFPVVHEALAPPANSLIGEQRVALRSQPVVQALTSGTDQVVQPDTRAASQNPAFLQMLEVYGGMQAQIVTAVRRDGQLVGIVSLHELRAPRDWTTEETSLARIGAELIASLLNADGEGDPE
jgi:GAF domain-containing protein